MREFLEYALATVQLLAYAFCALAGAVLSWAIWKDRRK